MNLSDDVSRKVVESCRVIQLVLPFLAIAALIFLGFVFSDFQGPMLTNKQPNQGSLFFAGVAFFSNSGNADFPAIPSYQIVSKTNER